MSFDTGLKLEAQDYLKQKHEAKEDFREEQFFSAFNAF